MGKGDKERFSSSFIIGVIALTFLIIGYQTALFIHKAAVLHIAASRDMPDTVYIYETPSASDMEEPPRSIRHEAQHAPVVKAVRNNVPRRKVESFPFDPNTVSVDDLCRLGFTPKQAQSIDNYRRKGGRFRRKDDFARSFVVSDTVFKRLERYIEIPLTDLNIADSAALDALPGIGGWFAAKIIEHRNELGGYSYKEQLMDIYRFDQEKFDGLSDIVTVSQEYVTPYPLWSLPADTLARHPYIGNYETARAIVLYRENQPSGKWTVQGLLDAGIISSDAASRLARCYISK